jgi:hypothetical protein
MAKKEPEKKALKAINKVVKKAMKHGVSGGLVDQTVTASIHTATVKAAKKRALPKKEVVKAKKADSPKKISKAVKREGKDDAED